MIKTILWNIQKKLYKLYLKILTFKTNVALDRSSFEVDQSSKDLEKGRKRKESVFVRAGAVSFRPLIRVFILQRIVISPLAEPREERNVDNWTVSYRGFPSPPLVPRHLAKEKEKESIAPSAIQIPPPPHPSPVSLFACRVAALFGREAN